MKAAELSTDSRNALKDSDYALPKQRKMPLTDAGHVRNALARFNQVKDVTDAEKATAKSRIRAAAKKFGIEVSADFHEWEKFAEPLLVAGPQLEVGQVETFGEVVRLPYIRPGEWDFGDYGYVEVTDSDLDGLVQNFQRDVRRQDVAVTAEAPSGEATFVPALPLNEEHEELPHDCDHANYVGPGAIGWIKDLSREGDTVYADVELNRLGEQLIRDDRYRAVSPELLLDWTDPETSESWGKTATGLALTTMPRMKSLAHRGGPMTSLAASEGKVLAFAELADVHIDTALPNFSVSYAYPDKERLPLTSDAAVRGSRARFMTVEASEEQRDEAWTRLKEAAQKHGVEVPSSWRELKASECAALLMQEGGEDTGEDSAAGMLAPCSFQPPYGVCPGYTRDDPDNDGDADCCLMAGRGCNGYIPLVSRATLQPPQSGFNYRESVAPNRGVPMADNTDSNDQGKGQAPAAATEPTPEPQPIVASEPAPEPQKDEPAPAVDHEREAVLAAERRQREELGRRLDAAEADAKSARQQVEQMKSAQRMAAFAERLDSLVRSGRVTPAEREKYSENLAKFAENEWVIEALEQRPANSAVDMSERGSGEAADSTKSHDQIIADRAHVLMAEAKDAKQPMTMKQAILKASAELLHGRGVGYQG